jgi:hypothetical protein
MSHEAEDLTTNAPESLHYDTGEGVDLRSH